jgi:hypothetical protein
MNYEHAHMYKSLGLGRAHKIGFGKNPSTENLGWYRDIS